MSTSLTDTASRLNIVVHTDTATGRDYDWNGDGANLSTSGYELQNSQCGQVLVNAFEFGYAVDTITSITFFLGSNSQAGANLRVVLYEYDNIAPMLTPPFLYIPADPYQLINIGVWKTLKLTTPVCKSRTNIFSWCSRLSRSTSCPLLFWR